MNSEHTEPDIYRRMVEMIERRYHAAANKSLREVYALDEGFLITDSDADFAIHNWSRMLSVLEKPEHFEGLVQIFLNLTIEFTYASNQFIQLNEREKAELRRIYATYLRDFQNILSTSQADEIFAERLKALVASHFYDLRANITRFFDPEANGDDQANIILNRTICADYSPALQMEILGLQMVDLIPPVLDIGCGKCGLLVRFLNENGIRAVGIDRLVEDSPNLIQADWLDFQLEPGEWGTVISHMAFSNHFVFQHWYKHGQVEPYARQYMAILRALKPGGSFYYAPGLPFIETYLPGTTYRVTREQVKAARAYGYGYAGTEDFYSCRVQRVAR